MNVHVPGEGVPVSLTIYPCRLGISNNVSQGYAWFLSIVACLAAFALIGGYSTYKFMVRN